MKWKDTVLEWDELNLIAKAHDYDYKYAFLAQAKKSFEAGWKAAVGSQPEYVPFCETCGDTYEVPIPSGDYPLSLRMRPCPDCSKGVGWE